MTNKDKYYLTTAIPYVNAKPHIGHALEYVIADAIHRYQELIGKDTYFVSGADENAIKNIQAAREAKMEPKKFLDKHSKIFEDFYSLLGADLDEFRRGTDSELHWPGVQKIWKLADKNGDIYKKKYVGLYCVGCASFKTEKDLVNGKCPDHDKKPEKVEEENYFFKLSKYQEQLIELVESDKYKVYPKKRKNEVLSFIKSGLEDFSISRSNKRAQGVGVPVPGDDNQKMYVWFDALTIYLTGVGWGYDEKLWKEYWPADLHIIGKDIIRFHAVYWPAMLLSASLPLPKSLLVHGFISSGGRKMSKTLGNVIDPYEIIDKYGVDALRYYLLAKIPTLDDGDFTLESFEQVYQADLANGLGNLVNRVIGLASKYFDGKVPTPPKDPEKHPLRVGKNLHTWKESWKDINDSFETFKIDQAPRSIWKFISEADGYINKKKPWELDKAGKDDELAWVVYGLCDSIHQLAWQLLPFLPETSRKIAEAFKLEKVLVEDPNKEEGWTNIKPGTKINLKDPLFPRLD